MRLFCRREKVKTILSKCKRTLSLYSVCILALLITTLNYALGDEGDFFQQLNIYESDLPYVDIGGSVLSHSTLHAGPTYPAMDGILYDGTEAALPEGEQPEGKNAKFGYKFENFGNFGDEVPFQSFVRDAIRLHTPEGVQESESNRLIFRFGESAWANQEFPVRPARKVYLIANAVNGLEFSYKYIPPVLPIPGVHYPLPVPFFPGLYIQLPPSFFPPDLFGGWNRIEGVKGKKFGSVTLRFLNENNQLDANLEQTLDLVLGENLRSWWSGLNDPGHEGINKYLPKYVDEAPEVCALWSAETTSNGKYMVDVIPITVEPEYQKLRLAEIEIKADYVNVPSSASGEIDAAIRVMGVTVAEGVYPVVIVPGAGGTTLEEDAALGGNKVWGLGMYFRDILRIAYHKNGKPIEALNPARIVEIIGVPYIGLLLVLGDLPEYKAQQTTGVFRFDENVFRFPYDWRRNIEDIVNELEETIEKIEEKTKLKKVVLISHSTGGLVCKKYIQDHSDRVDTFIAGAVPNLGSPEAFRVLRYGNTFGVPAILIRPYLSRKKEKIIYFKATARNIPVAYDLLPSRNYSLRYFIDDADVDGDNVTGILYYEETKNVLKEATVNDRDSIPKDINTFSPNYLTDLLPYDLPYGSSPFNFEKLRPDLVEGAKLLHDDLDNWQLPQGVNINTYAVIGTGKPTIKNMREYVRGTTKKCDILLNMQGDGTVPATSAEAVFDNTIRYYAPLNTYSSADILLFNDLVSAISSVTTFPITPVANYFASNYLTSHGLIFWQIPVIDKTVNILRYTPETRVQGIEDNRPNPSGLKMEQASVFSPVELHLYDASGNHTGPTGEDGFEMNVHDSFYDQVGDINSTKIVCFPPGDSYRIVVKSVGGGEFDLKIRSIAGTTITRTIAFENIPITPTMTSELLYGDNVQDYVLKIDMEGDGIFEATAEPTYIEYPHIVHGGGSSTRDNLRSSIMVDIIQEEGTIMGGSLKYFDDNTRTFVRGWVDNVNSITSNEANLTGSCSLNDESGYSFNLTLFNGSEYDIEILDSTDTIAHSNFGIFTEGDFVLKPPSEP
jgi:pimeloyl-ACP methyl ester carboxylesterase